MKKLSVAVVGATGLVGRTFLKVMEERRFPVGRLGLFASEKSVGKAMRFGNEIHEVKSLAAEDFSGYDLAFFSAGSAVAEQFAPVAARHAAVIDNSSHFRATRPLVVPEINAAEAVAAVKSARREGRGTVIANPNCSTIQAVLPLYHIDKKFGLKSVRYFTYQAVSGSGMKGISALNHAKNGIFDDFYPVDISISCLPAIGDFSLGGSAKEEEKMIFETKKILSRPALSVSATCVRVPVPNCHAVAVSVELASGFAGEQTAADIRDLLKGKEGILVADDPARGLYPVTPFADGHDETVVGRIRSDSASACGIQLFTVADNLRRGAASNALGIAEKLIEGGAFD